MWKFEKYIVKLKGSSAAKLITKQRLEFLIKGNQKLVCLPVFNLHFTTHTPNFEQIPMHILCLANCSYPHIPMNVLVGIKQNRNYAEVVNLKYRQKMMDSENIHHVKQHLKGILKYQDDKQFFNSLSLSER